MLLSLVLVFVNAHPRPSGLFVQPTLASLAAVQGVESPAILTSAAKVLRAPDLRHAGDADDFAFACVPPLLALNSIPATALCTPDALSFADENVRPEPRAPPIA
jgi:hypothetical protein